VSAVAADEVSGSQSCLASVGIDQLTQHRVRVVSLRASDEASVPVDVDPTLLEAFDQRSLRLGLRQEQQERVGGVAHTQVEQGQRRRSIPSVPAKTHCLVAAIDEPLGDGAAQHFQSARLQGQRPRLCHRAGLPVHDAHRDAEARQLCCQGQPGGACTHDQDVDRTARRRHRLIVANLEWSCQKWEAAESPVELRIGKA